MYIDRIYHKFFIYLCTIFLYFITLIILYYYYYYYYFKTKLNYGRKNIHRKSPFIT